MMTYHMGYDEVLDLSLSQFNACLRLAKNKAACEYKEHYKVFMSKLPSDVKRYTLKNRHSIDHYNLTQKNLKNKSIQN